MSPSPQSGQGAQYDGRRIPDALWSRLAPLIPAPPPSPHPRRGHRPRRPDRQVLDAVLYVMRTRGRWADADHAGLCSRTPVHDRFREWSEAGLFPRLQALADPELDELAGRDWRTPPRRRRGQSG